MTSDEHIWLSAVRYALGRRTYVVPDTVDFMLEKLPTMSEKCKHLMSRDIQREVARGAEGHIDVRQWERLRDAIEDSIDRSRGI